MVRLITMIFTLLALVMTEGCGWMWVNTTGFSGLTFYTLSMMGSTTVATGTCRAYLLKTTDGGGNLTSVSQSMSISVSGAGSGNFYADPGCATPASAVTLPSGTSYLLVYFQDAVAEGLTFSAHAVNTNTVSLSITTSASAQTWTQQFPASRYYPATGIYMQAAAFHWIRNSMILYGGDTDPIGSNYSSPQSQMWEYNGTTWSQICAACPPGNRAAPALVYDSARNKLVLFGGSAATTGYPPASAKNDTWEWDGTTWTQVFPGGVAMPQRTGMWSAYDSNRKRMVIFGGLDGAGTDHNDVYEYDGVNWYGPLSGGSTPSIRDEENNPGTFDPVHNLFLIYGGYSGTNDDLYSWNGATWVQICAACTGTSRSGAFLTFDQSRNKLILSEGTGTAGTWEMNGTTHVWTGPTGGGPAPSRDGGTFTFNYLTGYSLFVGGNSCGPTCDLDDTWTYYP